MRINKFVALANGMSRRAADTALAKERVHVNGRLAEVGMSVTADDSVTLDGRPLNLPAVTTVLLNKPSGYVTGRAGQGSRTIYELLPANLHNLKPVGRLDKNSSGLLLLTNDGDLAHQLTHPSYAKEKRYEVQLNKALADNDKLSIAKGVSLDDGLSRLVIKQGSSPQDWQVTMTEGRNRQIRRTFAALGYKVTWLRRVQFGPYVLDDLPEGQYRLL